MFRGGKLMTISLSHLKVQRVGTWMQIETHDKKMISLGRT
jgi:hypothetical protein